MRGGQGEGLIPKNRVNFRTDADPIGWFSIWRFLFKQDKSLAPIVLNSHRATRAFLHG